MKFLLFSLLYIAICLKSILANGAGHDNVASIMTNTTVFHKCTAFFVTEGGTGIVTHSKTLVTTASCVFNSKKHNYSVGVGDVLSAEKQIYDIEEIIIHPNYSKNPDLYNIAVVHIDKPSRGVVVYELVKNSDHQGVTGSLHLWRFVDRIYQLTENDAVYVSEEIYERATNLGLNEKELPIMSINPVTNGYFDVGVPFTVKPLEDVGDLKKDHNYVLGILVKPNLMSASRFFTLYSIPDYYSWISSHLKYDYLF